MSFFSTMIYKTTVRCFRSKSKLAFAVAIIFYYLRFILVETVNPQNCKMDVHGKSLWMPLSHDLPYHVARYPLYDTLIGRISAFIRQRHGKLVYVDVGANIGDSVLAARECEEDTCLAIEPDDVYFKYLESNTNKIPGVTRIQTICSSDDGIASQITLRGHGTARLVNDPSSARIKRRLDTILFQDMPEFRGVNFIKIDTDGHDFQVLKGAVEVIRRNQPAVLFECWSKYNPNYLTDAITALEQFKDAGYSKAVLYDNFGYLFSIFNLAETNNIKFALIYQLMSRFYYFDVLMLKDPDIDAFLVQEWSLFADAVTNAEFNPNATKAARE